MNTFYSAEHKRLAGISCIQTNVNDELDSTPVLGPNQKKWLEALRSGNYKQGIKYLKRDNKYCCLGVAGELFHDESLQDPGSCSLAYCDSARKELLLISGIGQALEYKSDPLYKLNDDQKLSFSEIADHIEENPTLYFYGPK